MLFTLKQQLVQRGIAFAVGVGAVSCSHDRKSENAPAEPGATSAPVNTVGNALRSQPSSEFRGLGSTLGTPGSPATAAPRAGEGELATELARLMLTPDAHRQIAGQTAAAMEKGLQASGKLVPGLGTKLEQLIMEAFPYEESIKLTTKIYARRFTERELREIIAFYRTPTGGKLARELPSITKDVNEIVSELLPKRLPELMRKHGLSP